MDFPRIKLNIDGTLAVLTLNHPETMNAMGAEMLEGINQALDEVEDGEHGLRALMITGEGRGFCAGANLNERSSSNTPPSKGRIDFGSGLETGYHPVLRRLKNLNVPIITAVNGAAAGVGMSFALMGDMVIASQSAYFLQAFRRIGLVPDGGSTWILPRLVGVARAREMSLMGERIPAATALDWGMVNRVYEDGDMMGEATKVAKQLADGPTVALTLTRNLYWNSLGNSYEEQIDLERQSQRIAGRSHDRQEGVQAFMEKREAKFTGK
jgi:2-(1,2-epoxy-1,2-dihydrophenyl)acetyl-CoA isomerase